MTNFEIFDKLKNTSGKLQKIEIIKENKDNNVFIEQLKFLLDTNITTGISTKKISNGPYSQHDYETYKDFISLMKFIEKNNTGTAYAVDSLINSINAMAKTQEEINFMTDFFTKKYKIGVSEKTLNSIFPNAIKTHNPMKGRSISDIKDLSKLYDEQGFTISLKLDGIRAQIRKDKSGVSILSRQGKPLVGLTHLANEFTKGYPLGVYDGELLAKFIVRESRGDRFRRTISLVNSHEETKDVIVQLFDFVSLSEWDNQKGTVPYTKRIEELSKFVSTDKSKIISRVSPLYIGTEIDEINKYLEYATNIGAEGIMVNKNSAPYQFTRTNALLKVKEFDSADLLAIDVVEGQGKHKGRLGAIVVQYKGDSKINIGFGLSDEERQLFWDNPQLVIGKIIEVQFQSESRDKNGKLSLQFAGFVGIRHDKGPEDVRYSDKDGDTNA